MQSSSSSDRCTDDEGLDYIFGYMGAVYGAAFIRHWDGNDPGLVRQVWKEKLGLFLTYKPSMDYALEHLPAEFPPSAITFRNLCNAGPAVPRDTLAIENNPSQIMTEEAKQKALKELRELKKRMMA